MLSQSLKSISFLILLSISYPSYADVIQGKADLHIGSWDFSDSAYVQNNQGDMFLMEVHDPNWGFVLIISSNTGSMFASVFESFDSLTTAPTDSSAYEYIIGPCVPLYASPCIYYTYIIKTSDDHYAKFRIIQSSHDCGFCIKYVYQPDGSGNLDSGVPVRKITWGEMKQVFH